ncbi:PKD domain-containing protein, partial [Bacteroidota bacterium]
MKTTLAITMLVLISLGGLAQKPQRNLQTAQEISSRRPLSVEYKKTRHLERTTNERHETNDRQIKRTEFGSSSNLKAGIPLFSEKMDSLVYYEWNLQTMSWDIFGQEYFEYDSMGNNTLDTWLGTDFDTVYPSYGYQWEIVWDANGRMVESYDYDWSDSSGFELYSKDMYEYDANGNQTVEVYYTWNKLTQSYYPSYTDTSIYDGSGNRLENVSYYFDTLIMEWNREYRIIEVYDTPGSRIQRTEYWWNPDSSLWDANYQTTYFNDAMGRDTSSIEYYWDGFSWRESWKEVTGYDANGNMILEAFYNWDGESQWYGSSKYEYTFNASNAVTEEIDSYWDYFNSKWYIENKYTYNHDGIGNIIEEASFLYDTASMTYINDWKDIYEYDLTVDMATIAIPYELKEDIEDSHYPFISKALKYTELYYDTTLMVWDTSSSEVFYYSPFDGVVVEPVYCDADFRFTVGQDPLTIIFTNASAADVSAWYWTFGDGTTSTLQHPEHTYKFPGTYKVSLSTTDLTGNCSNTNVQQVKAGNTLCNAEFSMAVDTLLMSITLTNTSQGTNLSYFWSFGDGEVSTQMSPAHKYTFAGSYDITLTIQNDIGTCMDRFSLSTRVGTAVCKAEFDVFVDSSTNTASFRSKNQNPANLYRWEFGDGSVEKSPNVTKTFTHA